PAGVESAQCARRRRDAPGARRTAQAHALQPAKPGEGGRSGMTLRGHGRRIIAHGGHSRASGIPHAHAWRRARLLRWVARGAGPATPARATTQPGATTMTPDAATLLSVDYRWMNRRTYAAAALLARADA